MSSYLISMLATMFAMQTAPTQPTAVKKDASPTPIMTLTGCLSPDAEKPGSFTFSDSKTGVKYRLTAADDKKDEQSKRDESEGKRGEIALGAGARRVTIRGGLVPSANLAAQAGAIDASKAVTASAPGSSSGTGTVRLPEFQATQVQASKGSCP
jgi:hypothetical protein